MAKTKTIFEADEEAEARAIAEAETDIDTGRVVPHEEAVKWLRSWGTPVPCQSMAMLGSHASTPD